MRPISTGIDFGIRGNSLCLEHITAKLGVEPTCGFEKGEPYVGHVRSGNELVSVERLRPYGVWHYCTSELLQSNNIEDHVDLMIKTLSPAKATIAEMIADPIFFVRLSIWVMSYSITLDATRLSSLSRLAEEISFTYWDERQQDTAALHES